MMPNEPVTLAAEAVDPFAEFFTEKSGTQVRAGREHVIQPPTRLRRQEELEMMIIGQATTSLDDARLTSGTPAEHFIHVVTGDDRSINRFLFEHAQAYFNEHGRLLTRDAVESIMRVDGHSLKRAELGERTVSLLVRCQSMPCDRDALPQMLIELETNYAARLLHQRLAEVREMLLATDADDAAILGVLARMRVGPRDGLSPKQVLEEVRREIMDITPAQALQRYFSDWETSTEPEEIGWTFGSPRSGDHIDLTIGNLTDLGYAERLRALHGDDVRWVPAWGAWMAWNGARWMRDDVMTIERYGASVARRTFEAYAALPSDDSKRSDAVRKALTRESSSSIRGSLEQFRNLVPTRPDVFDRDRWALNVPNGTIDLRTGHIRPHDRSDMITKMGGVDYDRDSECPTWESFLMRIFGGDTELIRYIQKLVGMTLSGVIADHCFIILNGYGANGKSTFIEVVRLLMGSYAGKMDKALLLSTRRNGGSSHSDGLAAMQGVRFASADETDDSDALSEAFIKQLTSGERVSARAIYSATMEYDPELTLWLDTNHLPAVHRGGHAMWRRIQLIPFGVTIGPSEKISNYAQKMVNDEGPGILKWAVDGCLRWQSEGLAEQPRAMVDASETYRTEEDKIRRFLDDRCLLDQNLQVGSSDLYTSYRDWCEQQGHQSESQKRLVGRLRSDHGIGIKKANYGSVLLGLDLRP